MSNKERAEKWLNLVTEDLSVAEDLFKTGHWLYTGFMWEQTKQMHAWILEKIKEK